MAVALLLGIPALIVFLLAALVISIRLQLRMNHLRRGLKLEGTSRLDRWAMRWQASVINQEAKQVYRAQQRRDIAKRRADAEKSKSVPWRASAPSSIDLPKAPPSAKAVQLAAATPVRRDPVQQPPPAKRISWREMPGAPRGKHGAVACFIYVDADGVVTEREIHNWTIASRLIEGYCLDRQQVRTFRLDRIDQWINWRV